MMGMFVTLPFKFNLSDYVLLIRINTVGAGRRFHVTPVTDSSNSKIYGSYIFLAIDGRVQYADGPAEADALLISSLESVLSAYEKKSLPFVYANNR